MKHIFIAICIFCNFLSTAETKQDLHKLKCNGIECEQLRAVSMANRFDD